MLYPHDADGDVFRRLESGGFNFSVPVKIDFNIDTDHWPLTDLDLQKIQMVYPDATVIEDDDDGVKSGYLKFSITEFLTYDLVIKVQREATKLTESYGGVCNSWGVLHRK